MQARHIALTVGTTVFCALVGVILSEWVPALQYLELQLQPPRFVEPRLPIRLVLITEDSIGRLGDPPNAGILSRRHYGELISGLRKAGAAALIVDITFPDPSSDDAPLRMALENSDPLPTILGAQPLRIRRSNGAQGFETTFKMPVVLPMICPPNVTIGSVQAWEPDASVRGVPLLVPNAAVPGQILPYVSLMAYLALRRQSPDTLKWDSKRSAWRTADHIWPVGPDGSYETCWVHRPFPEVELAQALELLRTERGKQEFRRTIVILASLGDSQRTDDRQITPVGEMSGGQFVANVLNSIAGPPGEQASAPSLLATLLWAAILSLPVAIAFGRLHRLAMAFAAAAASFGVVAVPRIGSIMGISFVGTVHLLLAVCLTALLSAIGQGLWRSRFIPRYIRQKLEPGRHWEVCVLFADMKGSTRSIQGLSHVAGSVLLTEVVQEIVNVCTAHGGQIEQTLGDGAKVLFFAERDHDYKANCLRTIQALRERMIEIGPDYLERYNREPLLTMGAECGTVTGQILRTRRHEEWTYFGMTIHLAARLQAQCGDFGVDAIIGPELAKSVPTAELLGIADLKGIGNTQLFRPTP